MRKNTASQKLKVFAFNKSTNAAVTGDAANITCKLSLDYGTRTATNDTNPTEAEDGFYYFDLTQAETNADVIDPFPESATSNVQVIAVPGTIYTTDTVYVLPLTAQQLAELPVTTIRVNKSILGGTPVGPLAVLDASGAAVNLSAKTVQVVIQDAYGNDLQVIANGSITKTGASSNQITFTLGAAALAKPLAGKWALRDVTGGTIDIYLLGGPYIVDDVATVG